MAVGPVDLQPRHGNPDGGSTLGFVSGDSWSGAGNVTGVPQALVAGETKSYTNMLEEGFFRLNKGSWGVVLVRRGTRFRSLPSS